MFFNDKITTNLQKCLTETEKFCVLTFHATSQIKVLAWNASKLPQNIYSRGQFVILGTLNCIF